MIDYFALALGHGLLVVAFLRLVARDELDQEAMLPEPEPEVVPETEEPRRYRSGSRVRR